MLSPEETEQAVEQLAGAAGRGDEVADAEGDQLMALGIRAVGSILLRGCEALERIASALEDKGP